jgi:acetyl/propionyl-CoA carboxylase alpha subunit
MSQASGMRRAPVLIANRGEIAIRIARTCRALGFPAVALYSEADRGAEHVKFCDLAFFIGGSSPQESYLNIPKVIEAAKKSGARYVHPGYGFLSERSAFAQACQKAVLIFVGPSAESMEQLGYKILLERLWTRLGCRVYRVVLEQFLVPRRPARLQRRLAILFS